MDNILITLPFICVRILQLYCGLQQAGVELCNSHFTASRLATLPWRNESRRVDGGAARPMTMALCFLILIKLTHMGLKCIRSIFNIRNCSPLAMDRVENPVDFRCVNLWY